MEIAIAVVEHAGYFLVGQRGPDVPLAGCWEFHGGKVESGETPAEAAVRECREETGLTVAVVDRYEIRHHDYEHASVVLHFFACRLAERSTEPRGSFRWVARQELAELQFPPANETLLEQLTASSSRSCSA